MHSDQHISNDLNYDSLVQDILEDIRTQKYSSFRDASRKTRVSGVLFTLCMRSPLLPFPILCMHAIRAINA